MIEEVFGTNTEILTIIARMALVLVLTVCIVKIIQVTFEILFYRISKRLRIDDTQYVILKRLTLFIVYMMGFIYAASLMPGFASLSTNLMASAGIMAVVFGFAAREAFSNIISGVFIAIFEPFRVGDKVQIGEEYGTVEDITLRHTIIRTWREKRIIIPNHKISEETLINYSIKNPRTLGILEIGISFDSDLEKAKKIMTEEALKHRKQMLSAIDRQPKKRTNARDLVKVKLIGIGEYSQILRLYYWAPDYPTYFDMKFDLLENIKRRFDGEGIELPFPHRTLITKEEVKRMQNERNTNRDNP
jgi:small conductance mechanosensitive channel